VFGCYKNSHLLQRAEKFASLWIRRIQKLEKLRTGMNVWFFWRGVRATRKNFRWWRFISHLGITPIKPGGSKNLDFRARIIDTWACYNRSCEIKVTTSAIYAEDINIHYNSCAISYAMALIFKSVFAQSNMAGFALKMSEDYSWNCARNYEAQV